MLSPVTRVAAVHDLSGFGRTSLSVVFPIFSTLGIQVCPLPTAVLSSETGAFDDFAFVDLTPHMRSFLEHWQRLELKFDAVYSGFLGSPAQAAIVDECLRGILKDGGLAVVDPVLGDNGKLDPTQSAEMVESMRWLTARAGCITPNLTEAALLLGEAMPEAAFDQQSKVMDEKTAKDWLVRLAKRGPSHVVITSVPLARRSKNGSAVLAYDSNEDRCWKVDCEYIPAFYPGTGDTFTSVLTACLLMGDSLPVAMDRAVQFISLALRTTFEHGTPPREGIMLEKVLGSLRLPMAESSYEIF